MVLEQVLPEIGLYMRLARFFVVFALGVMVTRALLMPLTVRLMNRRGADEVSKHSISNLAGLTGVFISFIIALQSAQFGNLVTVLGTITAALTVAVGFGMRDQISNLVAGFLLYMDNPFIKGDYIEVNDRKGVVKEIKLRHTTIKNGSSEKTLIPNSMLTTNPVDNYSAGKRARTNLNFSVKPSKAGELEEIISETLEQNEDILEKPSPEITYTGLEDGKAMLKASFSASNTAKLKTAEKQVNKQIVEKAARKKLFEDE